MIFERIRQGWGGKSQANDIFETVYDKIEVTNDSIIFYKKTRILTIPFRDIEQAQLLERKSFMPSSIYGAEEFKKRSLILVGGGKKIRINVSRKYPTYENSEQLIKLVKQSTNLTKKQGRNYFPGWFRWALFILAIVIASFIKK